MIFDVYVGNSKELQACAQLFNAGPKVHRIQRFADLSQLMDLLVRDQHFVNLAVICGDYGYKEQAEIRKSIHKYEPSAAVIFYCP